MLRLHSKQVALGLQLHGKSLWSLCPWQAALRELSPLMTGECKAANVKDEIVWAISATCQLTKIYSTKISCCSHMFKASQMLRIGRCSLHLAGSWQTATSCTALSNRNRSEERVCVGAFRGLPLVKLLLFWTQHDAPTVHKLLFCMHSARQTNPLCRIRSNGALSNLVLGHCSCKHFKRL